MEEKIHNINLKPILEVNRWDTKRVKTYMDRIQKHISYIETQKLSDEHGNTVPIDETALNKLKNYKSELKRILNSRENIK